MINNDVKNWRGKTIGFRCRECGDIFQSMWETTCNKCRREEERHQEILKQTKNKYE
ncbi:hypothetical protein LCGC14_0641310 [marine sediment metagenome]|uniref:Uncharacterized protein n=1 Tax=marine sediment metagenome TaxID=412755 RepID=A0A0F9TKG9_9ZZZZ